MAKASTSTAKKTTSSTKAATKKTTTKAATKSATKKTATKARASTKARSTKAAPAKATKKAAVKTATKKATTKKAATSTTKAATKKATTKASAKTTKTTKAASKKTATKKTTKTATKKSTTKAAAAKPATRKSAKAEPVADKANENEASSKEIVRKDSLKSALKAAANKQRLAKEQNPGDEEKPKIAPAPMRPALRVAKRAEARRDKNQTFKVKTQIIYPAHGVGYITEIEKQEIAGISVELFVIEFEHEKMKLRVPTTKAAAAGMRNLSTAEQMTTALSLIEGKARIKRTMWSRRAQEYEAKINSGDLTSVAEVVRDLFRADDQPEQSYSERQLFEQARVRLGRELSAQRGISLEDAVAEIHKHLDRKERVGT